MQATRTKDKMLEISQSDHALWTPFPHHLLPMQPLRRDYRSDNAARSSHTMMRTASPTVCLPLTEFMLDRGSLR